MNLLSSPTSFLLHIQIHLLIRTPREKNGEDRIIYINTRIAVFPLSLSSLSLKDVVSPMATYQNVGLVNSPNINNNNNNHHHLSPVLRSDSYDYSSRKYPPAAGPQSSSAMPKHHYQNTTVSTKRDGMPTENGTNYSAPADHESMSSSTEGTKRLPNTNGKFSIQKMIRQGFSSWRTKRKLSSSGTHPSANVSTSTSTPPPSSAARCARTDNDLPQVPPSATSTTTTRSLSVDSISNQTSPQRIIVTEQIAPASTRSNHADNSTTVDFDRPPTSIQGYVQSPWANSSISSTMTEAALRPVPLPTNRMLPVHFADHVKAPAPMPPTHQTTDTNNSKMPVTNTSSSNLPRIPPPGRSLCLNKSVAVTEFFTR